MKRLLVVLLLALCGSSLIGAAQAVAGSGTAHIAAEPSVDQWLMRLHAASRGRAYMGTFVVSTDRSMSSSRIWHVCNGQQQVERVEALTGEPRSTYRRNDQVVTFLPGRRVVVHEKRESLGLFPDLLGRADSSLARYYRLKTLGRDRVAGLDADMAQLIPVDALRFGYRIWTEHQTGLVIKLQTLDKTDAVLEQAAFSELQLNAPVIMSRLSAQMDNRQGYRLRVAELVKTTAAQEGWLLKALVPGFRAISCNKQAETNMARDGGRALQCVFSDGLASVSLFMEPFDASQHSTAQQRAPVGMGATQVLTQRVGDWWLTAVGEVPYQTLTLFAQGLERTK